MRRRIGFVFHNLIKIHYRMASSNLNTTCYTKYDRSRLKCIDIGANLSDSMYEGKYNHHNKPIHPNDLEQVLQRSFNNHVEKIIITGTTLHDSKDVLKVAATSPNLYITAGVHPTRCNEFVKSGDPQGYLNALEKFIKENNEKVVAYGECGLDYDRLHFCSKEVQKEYFEKQLQVAKATKKPLFLHCRNSFDDFMEILRRHHDELSGGVIHSFTDTKEQAKIAVDMGYYIGINGCSLKTQENIDAMCSIPSEFLMIETDCPWCECKQTHAGFKYVKTKFPQVVKEKWDDDVLVKGRNEPARIIQVLEVMAGARGEDIYELAETMYNNTVKLFKI